MEQIWGNIDYTFMEEEISSYEQEIHEQNMEKFGMKKNNTKDILKVATAIGVGILGKNFLDTKKSFDKIQNTEAKFIMQKEKEYQNSLNSLAYKVDKEEYLKLKVQKYNNQIVPYELHKYIDGKKTEEIIGYRYVELSTYASMIHNTNLTRTGWNTTINDAIDMGYTKFIIPYHSFSCPYCIAHQNIPLTLEEVIDLTGDIEEQEGDILHPNCKCSLVIYDKNIDYLKPSYTKRELEEQYHIRQKTNSLTLQKEKIKTDIKIQQRLGNEDQVDILNQQRNKINKEIRKLKEALPTTELKKQVVAINR